MGRPLGPKIRLLHDETIPGFNSLLVRNVHQVGVAAVSKVFTITFIAHDEVIDRWFVVIDAYNHDECTAVSIMSAIYVHHCFVLNFADTNRVESAGSLT